MTASPRTLPMIRSGNAKVSGHGPGVPVTQRSQDSCPRSCPLFHTACYAENRGAGGRPSVFQQVSASRNATGDSDSTRVIREHNYRVGPRALRYNVSGDFLRNEGTEIDHDYIASTNSTANSLKERYGTVAWSYTHAWRMNGMAPHLFDYVVRASCETVDDVRAAHAAGWAAVITVPDASSPIIGSTIDGRRVVECPVTAGRRDSCADCRLCGRDAAVVAFPLHGARRGAGRRMLALKHATDAAIQPPVVSEE